MSLPIRVSSTAIGPYILERRLGKGGMGEVYRAYDERLRRRVAIKHVLAEKAEKANLQQRFRREARTVACLNHEAIVQIYDILETDEGDWIVMELVEGCTVRDLVDRRELPLAAALRLARAVASGLAVAHDLGIVHRDLKLENVMVTEKGQAKILDFGLAKQLEKKDPGDTTLSGEGMVVGTIRALSPEQIMEQEVDTRSDLFSFGTLLYEVFTGESPFRAESIVSTMTKVCRHRQPPAASLNPEVPAELSELIDRLLEKDPERRPQSAREVVAFFDRLTGETTSLPPPSGLADPVPETADDGEKTADDRPRAAPDCSVAIKTLVSAQVADRPGLAERLGEDGLASALARLAEARSELLREHLGQESAREDHVLLTFERPASAVGLAL
ncbi:MAG TPA: serine/threonine-protein kinase, partial [Thermoanaerobaculia bacterium]